jgi:competence protein ComEC
MALVWLHLGPPPPAPVSGLTVTVLDVGQGQAVVLEGPGGCSLVDAGGGLRFDPGERVVLPFLVRRCGRRLESLVLTHDHLDHVGGVAAVLRELEVGEFWIGRGSHRSRRVRRLEALAREQGTARRIGGRGESFTSGGVSFRLLGPSAGEPCGTANDRSIAAIAGLPPASVLIAGDLERCGERELVASGQPLAANALVLSHHGSRSGSDLAFLERVRPSVTVASVGHGNRFGHPHVEVLERLERLRIPLWRTDVHGGVRLTSSPDGWRVHGFRASSANPSDYSDGLLDLDHADGGGHEGEQENRE